MLHRVFVHLEPYLAVVGLQSPAVLISLGAVILIIWSTQPPSFSKSNEKSVEIPNAPGGAPILGHALSYKKDPPGCLRSIQSKVGSIFRLNLAGRRMVLIGATTSERSIRQISMAPESVLSSYQAIADIGFDTMLGGHAVHGTKLHKTAIQGFLKDDQFCVKLSQQLDRSIDIEVMQHHCDGRIPDLFAFVRRCVIRVVLDGLVGRAVLHNDNGEELIDEIIIFQDAIEEATAKAAVLPRILSVPFVLLPIQRMRHRLQRRIESQMQAYESLEKGPYLQVLRDKPLDVQSEMIVGLVFAAHKNPSIGAARTICLAVGNAQCRQESVSLKKRGLNITLSDLPDRCPTIRRHVLETLRTTAHTIGSLRKVQSDFTLTKDDGTKLQLRQGEVIAVSHLLVNTNEAHWQNARSFDPMRYTDEEVKTMKFDAPYVTFSSGIHKCPGETIGVSLMSLMVVHLLSRDLRLEGSLPDICFARATLAQRAKPVAVRLSV